MQYSLYLLTSLIYFNPTNSEPKGYYFTYSTSNYKRGDIVLLCVTNSMQVATMHHLKLPYVNNNCPYHTPYLLKQIVAVPGDWLIINWQGIYINGLLQSHSRSLSKYKGIALNPVSYGNFKLAKGEYWLLGNTLHSYDSRYFGKVQQAQIYRKALLILPINYLL